MRASFLSAPALAAALLLAAAPAADAQDFRWSGPVAAGQRVEIKGIHGAIRAEPSDNGQVEITAVRRAGRLGRVEEIRIERVMHDGGVTVCAVYPSAPRGRANSCTPGDDWYSNVQNQDGRVEFTVRVPRGVHFVGTTVNGDVHARSMPGDAFVSTVNGSVTVSAAGTVEATTVNGAIDAATARPNPGRDLRFKTVNGDITLQVPSGFGADVTASLLNGDIESDFPLAVSRLQGGRRAQGTIGGGGRALHLETVNGNIEIRRSGGR